MKYSEYWKNRFVEMEEATHQTSLKKTMDIQEQFDKSQKIIEEKINAWYQRYANNNNMSLLEARKSLNDKELKELKWDVEEYIKKGRENAFSGEWVKELENASAKAHISRLEALELQCRQQAETAFGNLNDEVSKHIKDVYKNSYYRTAFEIQKGVGVGSSFATLNDKLIEKVVNKPWLADGKNFSNRIWGNKTQLINQLHTSLSQMCITGAGPDKAISQIASKMNVSKANAGRLVMTESAYFSSTAQKECFKELDVERYEIVATLDGHTSDICQEMDGKVFKMSEYEEGVTAPPFHVNCRSCTAPYFDDEFTKGEQRAARDEEGDTYYVPADMTYKNWKKNVDNGFKFEQKIKISKNINEEQLFRPVNLDKNNVFESNRGDVNILAYKIINAKNNIYVSKGVRLKPKELHKIDLSITQSLEKLKIVNSDNLPTVVIIDSSEMQTGAMASYNAIKNKLYIDKAIGNKEKLLELQRDAASPKNVLSTYVHEYIHWMDAQSYRIGHGEIIDSKEYLYWIRHKSKKKIDKIINKGYNINEISNYANIKNKEGKYDEVYTEYRVKKLLGE